MVICPYDSFSKVKKIYIDVDWIIFKFTWCVIIKIVLSETYIILFKYQMYEGNCHWRELGQPLQECEDAILNDKVDLPVARWTNTGS